MLVAWCLDIDALFPLSLFVSVLPAFLLYYLRTEVGPLYTGSIQCTEGSRVNGSKSLQCGRRARLSLSMQQYTPYFRRVDTDYNKEYAIFTLVETCYTNDYGYGVFYALRSILGEQVLFILCIT